MSYDDTIRLIAANIRRYRTARKWTIQELAYRCDIERSTISKIESGRSNITIRTLVIIANALEIDPGDLFKKP